MKFFAITTLVGSSLLVGAVGGATMTLWMQGEGYLTVEKDASGKVMFNFDVNKVQTKTEPPSTEEPPAAS